MVLDPKIGGNHGDYGSFQSTQTLPTVGYPSQDHEEVEDHRRRLIPLQPPKDIEGGSNATSSSADLGEVTTSNTVAVGSTTANGVAPGSMAQDVYQRQPLLPPKGDEDTWDLTGGLTASDFRPRNGIVRIDVPPPTRNPVPFPKEKGKTLVAFLFLFVNWVLTTFSLSMVHERVPDRRTYAPLPDTILDAVGEGKDWALDVSEALIIVAGNASMLVILLHRHRFIVLRRLCLLLGLLYMMRSVTMYVTVLPVASRTYYCSPKANGTDALVMAKRVVKLLSGLGLSINGQHTYCGDYIYSGHTVILTTAYLVIQEYSPRRLFILHWLAWLIAVTGVVMVLLARGHYTVDVLIAYWVTTRLFWIYHTMANNPQLKERCPSNFLARVWWWPIFRYFEKNVTGVVPRQYECPLPPCWARRIFAKPTNRDS